MCLHVKFNFTCSRHCLAGRTLLKILNLDEMLYGSRGIEQDFGELPPPLPPLLSYFSGHEVIALASHLAFSHFSRHSGIAQAPPVAVIPFLRILANSPSTPPAKILFFRTLGERLSSPLLLPSASLLQPVWGRQWQARCTQRLSISASVQCAVCSVQCAVCSVQCVENNVQCDNLLKKILKDCNL